MKVANIIVTDIHKTESNLRNRYDYNKEIMYSIKNLISVIDKYSNYDRKYLTFLGDIFNRNSRNSTIAASDVNLMALLRSLVDGMFSVLGNHEETYYYSPFWSLFSNIRSESVKSIVNKNWYPQGYTDLIFIVDTLRIGDTMFYFNHYACLPFRAHSFDEKHSIGLFHQPICTPEVISNSKMCLGVEEWEQGLSDFHKTKIFTGYDYVFLGHMHSIYGHWSDSGCEIYWLASHGRTNHLEVNDLHLERNFPAVIFEGDSEDTSSLVRVEDNIYSLMDRKSTVKEDSVLLSQDKYADKQIKDSVRNYYLDGIDPVYNVKKRLINSELASKLCSDMIQGNRIDLLSNAINLLTKINSDKSY